MKYAYTWKSNNPNNPGQGFTLTFSVNPSQRIHLLSDAQVYHVNTDMFCAVDVTLRDNHYDVKAVSICNTFIFYITVYINPNGCEIIVVEKYTTIQTVASQVDLQPCNTTDIA